MTDRPTSTGNAEPTTLVAPTEPDSPPARRRRWRWIVGIVVTALVLGGLYLAAYLYAGTTVPRGTTVLGIDIGGQTQQQAEDTLRAQLPPIADAPVTLLVQDEGFPIVPSESGLNVDVVATARAAGPGASDPVRLIQTIASGGGPVDPVVVVDRPALEASITSVAEQADRDPVEGAVDFDSGEVVATLPQDGREIDQQASADLVAESYLQTSRPVVLPVAEIAPLLTEAEVTRAVERFAEPAMSGPVPLRSELGTSQLDTALLGRVLSMQIDDEGVLEPQIDGEALLEQTRDQVDALGRPPVDAAVRIAAGSPVVVPSEIGRAPDTSTFVEDVFAAVTQTGPARTVELPLVDQPAEFTTQDARTSGVRRVVAEFTTSYPHADYRNVNIGRAAELANNTFLKPGDVFSMNGVVGERTIERGFTTGFIIDNGRFMEGVGGGVSQLATTLFNAAHFAGFEDVEHHPHSFYIDRYPVGREATVSWGAWDLRFGNNTPYGAVVQAFIDPSSPGTNGSVTVRIWSTPYWDVRSVTGDRFNVTPFQRQVLSGEGCVPSSGASGFDIVVTRTLARNGSVEAREEIFTRYLPTPEVVCT